MTYPLIDFSLFRNSTFCSAVAATIFAAAALLGYNGPLAGQAGTLALMGLGIGATMTAASIEDLV